MTQPSLFHRVADTSIEVYHRDIVPTLQTREQAVYDALARCSAPITSYELLKRMQAVGTAVDLNSVRPRITALFDKGRIEHGPKRRCTVTGKRVNTWAVR